MKAQQTEKVSQPKLEMHVMRTTKNFTGHEPFIWLRQNDNVTEAFAVFVLEYIIDFKCNNQTFVALYKCFFFVCLVIGFFCSKG